MQQFAPLHDVAPVITAGVGSRHNDLTVGSQRHQRLQGGIRHLAHAKGGHPLGDRLRQRCATGQVLQDLLVQARTDARLLRRGQRRQHRAPERTLPTLVSRQRLDCALRQLHMVVACSPGL